jgi:hypothetical protein
MIAVGFGGPAIDGVIGKIDRPAKQIQSINGCQSGRSRAQ